MSQQQHDLTNKLAPYLDVHLVSPLLEFLQEKKIYPENEIMQAKLSLLEKTNMWDFVMDIYKKVHPEEIVPEAYTKNREQVFSKLKEIKGTDAEPTIARLIDQGAIKIEDLPQTADTRFLVEKFKVKADQVDNLANYAKLVFECGLYVDAANYLSVFLLCRNNTLASQSHQAHGAKQNDVGTHFANLNTQIVANDAQLSSALWGKLAADILTHEWDSALYYLTKLKEVIDFKSSGSGLEQLQQRSWLIHWSLFVLFNHPNGKNGVVDLFLADKAYLNVIETNCPHILRYLTTAAITNKKRRNALKDLVRVIEQGRYVYRDPITEFVECLYIDYDFEAAQQKLKECEQVLLKDFFLVACQQEFMENARLFIFETYCRIHKVIDIADIAPKLNMDQEAAEKWIVNLIRNAKLDAKIDSKTNQVVMGTPDSNIYQQVIEKTKSLSFKTFVLNNNIDKRVQQVLKQQQAKQQSA